MADARFFGDGLTYIDPSELKGKLIAIEGTDGVGRSTHIELLQEWLEIQGYGVITTGWSPSFLSEPGSPLKALIPSASRTTGTGDRRNSG